MKFKLIKLKSVDSTNNYALNLIKKKILFPTIIIAEKQTKGRGRINNKWISLKGNIFMSIIFEINKKYSLKKITNLNCHFIKHALKKFSKKKIEIKKPNDLLIEKKKFCGVLQETLFANGKKFIIVGIGINVFKKPNIKKYETTNLSHFSRSKINKQVVYRSIKNCYENNIERFL